jgi:hypothetical protein
VSSERWVKVRCNNCHAVVEKLDDQQILTCWGQFIQPDSLATIDICDLCMDLPSLQWVQCVPGIKIGYR